MPDTGTWDIVDFESLSNAQLYALLRLRAQIFVVEQDCVYLDIDNLDQQAWHMLYHEGDSLRAYQRCLPPGVSYAESSLGRIVVDPSLRGRAVGKALVRRGIEFNRARWPDSDILINAQAHLQPFYSELGFVGEGDTHLEDGILHRHMRLRA
jgi:ElaA protein